MANEAIPFECPTCTKINWVARKDIEDRIKSFGEAALFCWSCKRILFADSIQESKRPGHESEDYIHCINYTGPLADFPTGVISVGGKTSYVNAEGQTFTRDEWKQKYGADPAAFISERIKMHKLFHDGRPRRRF